MVVSKHNSTICIVNMNIHSNKTNCTTIKPMPPPIHLIPDQVALQFKIDGRKPFKAAIMVVKRPASTMLQSTMMWCIILASSPTVPLSNVYFSVISLSPHTLCTPPFPPLISLAMPCIAPFKRLAPDLWAHF